MVQAVEGVQEKCLSKVFPRAEGGFLPQEIPSNLFWEMPKSDSKMATPPYQPFFQKKGCSVNSFRPVTPGGHM
jgi:hypothetical protein